MVKAGFGWANQPPAIAEPLRRDGNIRILPVTNVTSGLKLPLYAHWMKQTPLGSQAANQSGDGSTAALPSSVSP
jgi:hypothetical protein